MHSAWIPLADIHNVLSDETYIVTWLIFFLSIIFYKLFLKNISDKRHNNLKTRFKNIPIYLLISTFLTVIQYQLLDKFPSDGLAYKVSAYLALTSLIFGAVGIIKLSQALVYEYLFFSNMSHGVPKLIVNLFTFILSLIIANLIASSIFNIHLTALMATSAVFSLVLGLALQDTLGNLFSGVSLQIESPFQIGDWIEVHYDNRKWLGQVHEISWRATFLMSFSDELIMIPNRTIGQSEIIIISQGNKNIRVNHTFRFSYDVDINKAKQAISEGIGQLDGIMKDPPIRILIVETNPSYLEIMVFYSLVDFSMRYRLGDQIIVKILESIKKHGLVVSHPKLEILEGKS